MTTLIVITTVALVITTLVLGGWYLIWSAVEQRERARVNHLVEVLNGVFPRDKAIQTLLLAIKHDHGKSTLRQVLIEFHARYPDKTISVSEGLLW